MTVFTVNPTTRRTATRTGRPAVNVIEMPRAFRLELFAPGFDKADFSIEVEDEMLRIQGTRPEAGEKASEELTYLRQEFRVLPFERRFQLPEDIDAEAIEANYEHGILRLELPLREEAAVAKRRIEIA